MTGREIVDYSRLLRYPSPDLVSRTEYYDTRAKYYLFLSTVSEVDHEEKRRFFRKYIKAQEEATRLWTELMEY